MSYPQPRYHGDTGEVSAILRPRTAAPDVLNMPANNGARWTDATEGDFLHVPPGGIHGFRIESGQPASMLLLFTPGAPREEYFETLAEVAQGRRVLRR